MHKHRTDQHFNWHEYCYVIAALLFWGLFVCFSNILSTWQHDCWSRTVLLCPLVLKWGKNLFLENYFKFQLHQHCLHCINCLFGEGSNGKLNYIPRRFPVESVCFWKHAQIKCTPSAWATFQGERTKQLSFENQTLWCHKGHKQLYQVSDKIPSRHSDTPVFMTFVSVRVKKHSKTKKSLFVCFGMMHTNQEISLLWCHKGHCTGILVSIRFQTHLYSNKTSNLMGGCKQRAMYKCIYIYIFKQGCSTGVQNRNLRMHVARWDL